jgi:hypothetical protein
MNYVMQAADMISRANASDEDLVTVYDIAASVMGVCEEYGEVKACDVYDVDGEVFGAGDGGADKAEGRGEGLHNILLYYQLLVPRIER